MKIVLAFDKFKGTLSALEACQAAAEGLREGFGPCEILLAPLADGGEGSTDVLKQAMGGDWISAAVTGPRTTLTVEARYLWVERTRVAAFDLAEAAGLAILPAHLRDPLHTTTRGVGELLALAIARGAERVTISAGGSATVDGGVGAASALGWGFLDRKGRPIPPDGGSIRLLDRIVPPETRDFPLVTVLCDVDHVLTGPEGAARVFGPQKGATPEGLAVLEEGLERLADVIQRDVGFDVRTLKGGGAAGGFGAGAAAFLGARLARGVDVLVEASGLPKIAEDADWVVTGEGRVDETSLRGKVLSGVLKARGPDTKVAVLAGRLGASMDVLRAAGVDEAMELVGGTVSVDAALSDAAGHVARCLREWGVRLREREGEDGV